MQDFPVQPTDAFDSPNDRLSRRGVGALCADELIALVLQRGGQGQGGVDMARRLARDFGSISRLAQAEPGELITLSSVNPEEAAAVVSSFRLAKLAADDPAPRRLVSAADVAAVATQDIGHARRERAIVLICDAANHLTKVSPVGEGTIDRTLLPVREILNAVLRHDGRAFAIAHNHPSGDTSPSTEDIQATDALRTAAGLVGLRFLEHVVVARTEWRSIKECHRRRY